MNLIKLYQKYVKWCQGINNHPVGFIKWKELKFDMTYSENTDTWIKN